MIKKIKTKNSLFILLIALYIFNATQIFSVEIISYRDSRIEAFLSEGKGMWLSTYPINGKELAFVFTKMGHFCHGEPPDRLKSCGEFRVYSKEEMGYYLELKEESGQTIKMYLEIKESYLIKLNDRPLKKFIR